jgi:hypothetical protein
MTDPIPVRVAERAARKHVPGPIGPLGQCWVSTYSTASHGYAQIGWWAGDHSQTTTAHRAAWSHVHGPIPDGLTVDHKCRVLTCVRVDHLRLLPNGANASDNGQTATNPPTDKRCPTCSDPMVQREGAAYKPYCRRCQNRRRRARRAAGKAN